MNEITIPALVPAATTGNLTNLIAERAWFEPNRVMMSRPLGDGWQKVSAQELDAEVRATAKGLIAAGIQIGDRVAIMARTRYEWTILDFAIWFAGGCVVPIYETSSAEQVDWILSDSGAVGLIVETPSHRELVNTILPSHTKHIWTMTEDVLSVLATAGAHIGDDEVDRRRNALLRRSISSSPMCAPALASTERTSSVIVQICLVCAGRTVFTNSRCVGVSTIKPTAPESLKIQSTCSAEDVS